jgi:hypothetical protein
VVVRLDRAHPRREFPTVYTFNKENTPTHISFHRPLFLSTARLTGGGLAGPPLSLRPPRPLPVTAFLIDTGSMHPPIVLTLAALVASLPVQQPSPITRCIQGCHGRLLPDEGLMQNGKGAPTNRERAAAENRAVRLASLPPPVTNHLQRP